MTSYGRRCCSRLTSPRSRFPRYGRSKCCRVRDCGEAGGCSLARGRCSVDEDEISARIVNRPALPRSWGGFTCGSAGGPRHIQPSSRIRVAWPGLTRAAEERGPLPPVSEFCRSRGFLGFGGARTRLGCRVSPMAFHREADDPHPHLAGTTLVQHRGLKPDMRCWEILTVAPQRRCRDADMRMESCRSDDRSSQNKRPTCFLCTLGSLGNGRHISAWSICESLRISVTAFDQIETKLWPGAWMPTV
jgi:hypothetical protein